MNIKQVGIIIHGIGRPERDLESGEAPYWISEEQFTYLLDMITALPVSERPRITFDDGNISDHDIALPALEARGLVAEFFVLTDRIGQVGSLNESHILALQAAGMRIGSHGVNHQDWAAASTETLWQEVSISREKLQDLCQTSITQAAIPFGSYNARVLKALKKAGYVRAYSSDRGKMDSQNFLCPRTSVQGKMQSDEFERLLSGQLSIPHRARRAISMGVRRILPIGY